MHRTDIRDGRMSAARAHQPSTLLPCSTTRDAPCMTGARVSHHVPYQHTNTPNAPPQPEITRRDPSRTPRRQSREGSTLQRWRSPTHHEVPKRLERPSLPTPQKTSPRDEADSAHEPPCIVAQHELELVFKKRLRFRGKSRRMNESIRILAQLSLKKHMERA